SCHYARRTRDWLATNGINFAPNTDNSPNVTQARPIQEFWSHLSRKIYGGGWEVQNKEQLRRRIFQKIREVDVAIVQRLMGYMIQHRVMMNTAIVFFPRRYRQASPTPVLLPLRPSTGQALAPSCGTVEPRDGRDSTNSPVGRELKSSKCILATCGQVFTDPHVFFPVEYNERGP
ncbi:hypothetical protein NQ318_015271, partial [Aromia moschata]